MNNYIIEVLKYLEIKIKENREHPPHVLSVELKKEISDRIDKALSELEENGQIYVGHTINDKFFKVVDFEEE